MEADFSGYATKANLKCSDGRTITADAFKHQDKMKVPLVWQHGHGEPGNVLGYAVLEHREDGVYTYGFFNDSEAGRAAKELVKHGDITALSIYANQLVEKAKSVLHGAIREVSLVLSGANPGALIDNVSIAHSDGDVETLEDEAVIFTGLTLEHSSETAEVVDDEDEQEDDADSEDEEVVEHADAAAADDETVQDVYDSLTDKQKEVVHFMIGAALEEAAATHSDEAEGEETVSHADDADEDQHDAAESADDTDEGDLTHQEGSSDMTRNVFDQNGVKADGPTLTHSQLTTIVEDAQKMGSFKESLLQHAAEYGIEDIDILFPDAQAVANAPELIARRTEWVADVINGTKHSPFARIKSTAADLTAEEARAKGYVKGAKKKDEIIKLLKRVTTPTTIYKKQKLDRDDIVDITDLDVVVWLKGEMRLMLDEELARAVLIGDGREPDDEDKIDEDHLRPIAYDDDMYTHKVTLASNASPEETVEAVLRARTYYRGTGTPTLYTTDMILTDLMLQKDKMGRRLYETEESLAAAMRVSKIVTVEVMQDTPDLLAIVVNLTDYTLGADRGGSVSMFDDFDIDYNQYKYLIETRVSGALTKPKSAVVINREVGQSVVPGSPSFDGETNTITIPNQTGVVYKIDGVTKAAGPVEIAETTDVEAFPATGYSFPHNVNTDWTYVYTA